MTSRPSTEAKLAARRVGDALADREGRAVHCTPQPILDAVVDDEMVHGDERVTL